MDNNEKSYPVGYDHVSKKVEDAQQRLRQLDQQISQVPPNSKPAPRLKPPGFVEPKRFNHERQVNTLKDQQDQIRDTTIRDIEVELKDSDPKTTRQVRERTLEAFYPNPFKKMTVAEKNKQHSQKKDINRAQDYMDSMFSTSQKKPEKEMKSMPEKQDKGSMSMSTRFSISLGYTGAFEKKTSKSPDKTPEPDKD